MLGRWVPLVNPVLSNRPSGKVTGILFRAIGEPEF
jgi:hypothetical protein